MASNPRVMPSPIGPNQMSMNPRSRDSPVKGSRDRNSSSGSGSDKPSPRRVPVMNMMRDQRQNSDKSLKSQRSGDGGLQNTMSFYLLLRELRPTLAERFSVITFVLTVCGSLLCFLPFYAYRILAIDSGHEGISGMAGLRLDASVNNGVSMTTSHSSSSNNNSYEDIDSPLFHAINR